MIQNDTAIVMFTLRHLNAGDSRCFQNKRINTTDTRDKGNAIDNVMFANKGHKAFSSEDIVKVNLMRFVFGERV